MKSFLIVALVATIPGVPLHGQAVEGVWKIVEVVVDSGPARGPHTSDVQPGLLIFTKRHFSLTLVTGFTPRPPLSPTATDEERARTFGPFTGSAGTYERGNSTISFTPAVAKQPAVMAGSTFTFAARVQGDTLWLTLPFGLDTRPTTKWVRVERP